MATGTVSRLIPAPRDAVWNLLADYGNVVAINKGIESSAALNDIQGVGGQRACEFGGGRGVNEEITAWDHGKTLQFEATEFRKLPMNKMVATFSLEDLDGDTMLTASWDAAMIGGVLTGWMANMTMRRAMRDMLAGVEAKAIAA